MIARCFSEKVLGSLNPPLEKSGFVFHQIVIFFQHCPLLYPSIAFSVFLMKQPQDHCAAQPL